MVLVVKSRNKICVGDWIVFSDAMRYFFDAMKQNNLKFENVLATRVKISLKLNLLSVFMPLNIVLHWTLTLTTSAAKCQAS